MVFYYLMRYSPETNKIRHWITFTHCYHYTTVQWSLLHNFTYSVHDEFLMIGPVLLSSLFPHGSLTSSAVADQLLILSPTGWARPRLRPSPHSEPISLRVHAPTHLSVCYKAGALNGQNTSSPKYNDNNCLLI